MLHERQCSMVVNVGLSESDLKWLLINSSSCQVCNWEMTEKLPENNATVNGGCYLTQNNG
jgi:hypothetical protein